MKKIRLIAGSALLAFLALAATVQAADLPDRFMGRYTSNVCSTCYWVLNSDETGEWSVGLNGGRNESIPVMWEAMIDKNGNLQEAKQGGNTGYALKLYFMAPLSDDVKSVLTSSTRDSGTAMAILWYDNQKISLQFMSETNGFYQKN